MAAFRILAVFCLALLRLGHCAATCYLVNGTAISDGSAELCNPSAEGVTGSHSSCCNVFNGDACLSSGLCYASWGSYPYQVLWNGACTDSTFKDSACFRGCPSDMSSYDNFFLLPCSLQSWCCCGYKASGNCDVETCCANNFTLANGPGSVIRVLGSGSSSGTTAGGSNGSPTTSTPVGLPGASTSGGIIPLGTTNPSFSTCAAGSGGSKSDSSTGTTTAAIVGGVLGSLFLATAVALGFVIFRNRQLSRSIAAAQAPLHAAAPVKTELATPPFQGSPVYHQPQVNMPHGSGNVQRVSEIQAYERPRSELPGQNWQT